MLKFKLFLDIIPTVLSAKIFLELCGDVFVEDFLVLCIQKEGTLPRRGDASFGITISKMAKNNVVQCFDMFGNFNRCLNKTHMSPA